LSFKDFFQAIFGVMMAAMGAGNVVQFMPDVGAAENAAEFVFNVLSAKPEIDIDNPAQNVRTPIIGEIEFRNVGFRYPTREKNCF